MSQVIRQAFGVSLMAEAIPFLSDAGHLVVQDKDGRWKANGTNTILFTPFPLVNGSASQRNLKGQPEFFVVNGMRVFNRCFWSGQRVNYFDRKINAHSSKMPLVLLINRWSIPENRWEQHEYVILSVCYYVFIILLGVNLFLIYIYLRFVS